MYQGLDRARDGDPSAKRAVVDALRPRITRMALHYARRCREDPDDLLQEAWLGLLEALPQIDLEIGCPEQYLISRARWRLLDWVKRARIRRCISLDGEAEGGGTLPDDAESAHSVAGVLEFIRSLSATQKSVLSCLLHGLTWRETGSILGFSSANVAYHVRQIRRRYEVWNEGAV